MNFTPTQGRLSRHFVSHRQGFTLFELLIVFLILIVLFAIAFPLINNQWQQARINQTTVQIGLFDRALQTYQMDHGNYPLSVQGGLDCLVGKGLPLSQVQPQGGYGMTGTGMVDPMTGGAVPTSFGGPQPGGMMGAEGFPAGGMADPMTGGAVPTGFGATEGMGMMPGMMPNDGGMGGMTDPMNPGMTPMGMDPMNPIAGNAGGVPSYGGTTGTAPSYVHGSGAGKKYFDAHEIPLDPWGEKYLYEYPTVRTLNGKPAIWSSGPNKTEGDEDDIISWKADMDAIAKDPVLRQQYEARIARGLPNTSPGGIPNPNQPGGNPLDPMGMGTGGNPMDPMGLGNPMQNNPMGGMGGMDPMGGMGGGGMMEPSGFPGGMPGGNPGMNPGFGTPGGSGPGMAEPMM